MENDFKEICSVKQLAGKLGLSKARFYQHLKNGVFPPPVYCIRTKRPLYPENLQQQCMDIRRTGIGYNGLPVIFYTTRKNETCTSQKQSNEEYKEIMEVLKNMHIKVTSKEIKTALGVLGIKNVTQDTISKKVIPALSTHFATKRKLVSNCSQIAVLKASN